MQGRALRGLVSASAEVVRETTVQSRVFRKTLKEHDEFVFKAVNANLSIIYDLFREDHVRRLVSKNGLAPYVGQPDSRVRQEIQAVMQHLGLNQDQATEYLRSAVQPEPVGSNDAHG